MNSRTPTTKVVRSLALAGMVSQIGCVTVVIVAGALLAGLWLDNLLGTKPLMTIALLLLSIPVSTYSLVRVALSTAAQFQTTASRDKGPTTTDDQPMSNK